MKKSVIITIAVIALISVSVVVFNAEEKSQRATLIKDVQKHLRSQEIQIQVQADRIRSCKNKVQIQGWDGYWDDNCKNLKIPAFPEWLLNKMGELDLTPDEIAGGDTVIIRLLNVRIQALKDIKYRSAWADAKDNGSL